MSSSSKQYSIEQVFSYGRKKYNVKVEVPMCQPHYEAASHKGPIERLIGCLGVAGGVLIGILAVVILMLHWDGDGGILAKLFVGAIFGFGMFILAWWIIAVLIAPLFAAPESKEARSTVRIVRFQPWDQMVQLEFRNEQMANLLQTRT
jgi:hypothetical protein